MNLLERLEEAANLRLADANLLRISGVVSEIDFSACRVKGLSKFVRLGEYVTLGRGEDAQLGEVVRIQQDLVTVKPFEMRCGALIGSYARRSPQMTLSPNETWKGRIVDALGRPIDDGPALEVAGDFAPLNAAPPPALQRQRINKAFKTGIKVIDMFTPICEGQRIGIFAGSGVGKSSLMSMFARAPGADTVVIALVGERGREVREFFEEALGEAAGKAIGVVSTGDESPMMRRLAPTTALSIAEYFRDRGEKVLLIVDSITRFAHASRDVALAAGEPPVARGYTPSVFSDIPRLLERAGPGTDPDGSITAVFSVLVDGDDHNDPVADTIRGTLDGHVVLDRAVAAQGRFPAVQIPASISRLAHHVWSPAERKLVDRLRALIARFEETRDLRLIGGYSPGVDPLLDQAVKLAPKIYDCMRQAPTDPPCNDVFQELASALKNEDGLNE